MAKYGLLVDYNKCDGCGKCVEACIQAHGSTPENSGLKISVSGPFTFPSGKVETYYIATPTDYCDKCAGREGCVCEKACPAGCITYGEVQQLGEKMTQRKMALFTIRN